MNAYFSAVVAIVVFLLAPNLYSQTVQLPTQQVFSVGTSVLVPDRGSINLGGVSRARESSVERGIGAFRPFKNRGIGREFSTTQGQATVRIIDLDEMDKEVLAAAKQQRATGGRLIAAGGASWEQQKLAIYLTQHMGRSRDAYATGISQTALPRQR